MIFFLIYYMHIKVIKEILFLKGDVFNLNILNFSNLPKHIKDLNTKLYG